MVQLLDPPEAGTATAARPRLTGLDQDTIRRFLAGDVPASAIPAPAWGPIGEEVFTRTYSRQMADGGQETWADTVRRVVLGNVGYAPDVALPDEAVELFELIYSFSAIPAGRHLWVTGTPVSQLSKNCWVSGWSSRTSDHFRFLASRLFEGGGVGANYSADLRAVTAPVVTEVDVRFACTAGHDDYLDVVHAAGALIGRPADPAGSTYISIPDSREGWVDAWCQVIDASTTPGDVPHFVFDVSAIRPHGAPLRRFGGTASGPAPFVTATRNIATLLSAVATEGRQLGGLEAMQIDHEIAAAVVAGGARRSARMSLMHWKDPEVYAFIACKADHMHHWSTNISVEIDGEFTEALAAGNAQARRILDAVAAGMVDNGEPGLVNTSLHSIGEPHPIRHTNPCVTGDAWVQTASGLRQVRDLVGAGAVPLIVNDEEWETTPDGFFQTGVKPVVELNVDGTVLRLTTDHLVSTPDGWRPAGDLTPGDAVDLTDSLGSAWGGDGTEAEGYLLGHLVGDGYFRPPNSNGVPGAAVLCTWRSDAGSESTKAAVLKAIKDAGVGHRSNWGGWNAHGPDKQELRSAAIRDLASRFGITRGHKTISPQVTAASSDFIVGFLRGLFDTDGHVEGSSVAGGVSVRLGQSDAEFLGTVRVMLLALGIRSVVRAGRPAGNYELPGGTYWTKDSFRLIIAGEHVDRFAKVIGFSDEAKASKLASATSAMSRGFYAKAMVGTVASIKAGAPEPVYDCQVPGLHAFVANGTIVHNCSEASLTANIDADGDAAGESCNLGSVNLEAFGSDPEGAEHAAALMARFLYRATLNPHPDAAASRIEAQNRRIGVGVMGLQGWAAAQGRRLTDIPGDPELRDQLTRLRQAARQAADELADALGTPRSVKVTAVAPTGTIAQMAGVTPGIHPVFAKRFIRRVRYVETDPELDALHARGLPIEPDLYAAKTSVVSFPVQDAIVTRYDEGLIEEVADVSPAQFLAVIAAVQETFCGGEDGQAVSATATIPQGTDPVVVAAAIEAHLPTLKGVTMFPDESRPQSPYERLDVETYLAMASTVAGGAGVGDSSSGECAGGACPIR